MIDARERELVAAYRAAPHEGDLVRADGTLDMGASAAARRLTEAVEVLVEDIEGRLELERFAAMRLGRLDPCPECGRQHAPAAECLPTEGMKEKERR